MFTMKLLDIDEFIRGLIKKKKRKLENEYKTKVNEGHRFYGLISHGIRLVFYILVSVLKDCLEYV